MGYLFSLRRGRGSRFLHQTQPDRPAYRPYTTQLVVPAIAHGPTQPTHSTAKQIKAFCNAVIGLNPSVSLNPSNQEFNPTRHMDGPKLPEPCPSLDSLALAPRVPVCSKLGLIEFRLLRPTSTQNMSFQRRASQPISPYGTEICFKAVTIGVF